MNILINGAGAIGIGLGASLISQGFNLSFYARSETGEAIANNGIKRVGLFNEISCSNKEFNVYTNYEDMPKEFFDYVLVTSKTIANDDISKKLDEYRSILKKDCKIIIFQNGFGNDEPYLRFFNKNQVYCARVITGFMRPLRNVSKITVHTEPILLGSLQGADLKCLKPIAKAINDSGIPCEVTDELSKFLWAKMLYNCALNPLGAVLKVNYGRLTENDYSKSIMNKIIAEIFSVMAAAGYTTNWKNPEEYEDIFYSKLVPDTYNHYSSTYQDIEKHIPTEIDSLNGKVVSIGEKYGIDVSVNRVLYNLIKAIESDY